MLDRMIQWVIFAKASVAKLLLAWKYEGYIRWLRGWEIPLEITNQKTDSSFQPSAYNIH
jgi:hypothetical protein